MALRVPCCAHRCLLRASRRLRRLLAAYSTHRDLITIGAYKAGSDPDTDEALARWSRIEAFLRQDTREAADLDSARHALQAIFEDKGTS